MITQTNAPESGDITMTLRPSMLTLPYQVKSTHSIAFVVAENLIPVSFL